MLYYYLDLYQIHQQLKNQLQLNGYQLYFQLFK
nr:MAG TPA: hypothetical protein [Caudoviricetes sp.]DAS34525.1 MAG TPA: hypothetical protein [Bacteriophage sp.]